MNIFNKSLFPCLALVFSAGLLAPQAASAQVPTPPPVPSSAKVTVCHNGNTLSVSSDAVQNHVDHGDTLGECEAPRNTNKVTMCYEGNTITVSKNAVSAHEEQGGTLGACDADVPPPPPPPPGGGF